MENRIYVRDLDCYRLATEEERSGRLVSPDRFFDLSRLPTEGLQDEFGEYLWNRGRTLSLKSIRAEFWPYHVLCRFLCDCYSTMESLREETPDVLVHSLKAWMMKNGYSLTQNRRRTEYAKTVVRDSDVILFLKRVISFFCVPEEKQEMEKDIWNLDRIGFPVRNHPVHPVISVNFTRIPQKGIREEVKRACAVTLRYLAASSVAAQIHAADRLAGFLKTEYPHLQSLTELDREMLEEYLIEINTRVEGKKSFHSELHHLKSLLDMIGKIYEKPGLCRIFVPGDIPPAAASGRKPYSDGELRRLNEAIIEMDEQFARAVVLHQILGNRISETLTLKKDCLVQRGAHAMVRVFLIKTQKTCEKPVTKEAVQLIRKSIAYTREKYGDREYIFVDDKNPDRPLSYEAVQYRIMVMIREKDLRDDHGQLFGVGTHRFRNTLGQRLTQMHVDDITIGKILGHSGTGSVQFYRQFGNQAMAEETKAARASMDEVLNQLIQGW